MVCYICGKPASFRCPVCERYVCSEHTRRDISSLICSKCFDLARQKVREEQQDEYYHTHYCDLHKCYHDDKYLEFQRLHSVFAKYYFKDIVYCETCEKQMCINSAIKGETKEFKDRNPTDHYETTAPNIVWLEVTKYLCPICGNIIFLEVDIYCEVFGSMWSISKKYKYSKTIMIRKYTYYSRMRHWSLNPYFKDLLY